MHAKVLCLTCIPFLLPENLHGSCKKGCFPVTEVVHFDTMLTEQAATWLQGHLTFFAGYALALAQRTGLGPEEAARFFMEPLRDTSASHTPANAETLERQARGSAAHMALMHGKSNVELEHDGKRWVVKTSLTHDKAHLAERWGTSMEFFARWVQEQARIVGRPKGIEYSCWLDSETLCVQLALL